MKMLRVAFLPKIIIFTALTRQSDEKYNIYPSGINANKEIAGESKLNSQWSTIYPTKNTLDAAPHHYLSPLNPHRLYSTYLDHIQDSPYGNQDSGIYQTRFKKKKKKTAFTRKKILISSLLTHMMNFFHFIPLFKIITVALFMITLFSTKALLISIGTLILVLYDTFYKRNLPVYLPRRDKDKSLTEVHEKGAYHHCWNDYQANPFNVNPWEINKGLSTQKRHRFHDDFFTTK